MINIKKNIINVKTSSTLAINELSKKLEEKGKKIYKFGLGQSPFPVPESIVKELQKNAHKKDYLDVSGLLELRQSIAKYHTNKNKHIYDSKNVLIGPGSKELIFQIQLILNGDLLLPCPSWVSYEPQAKIINKKIHWITTSAKDNWHITPTALEKKCQELKNIDKFLILNSPNNPSGTIHPDLNNLAKVAKKNNLIVISDEIYGELNYRGIYESITHYYPEGTIISSGISKWCGAGGWRLGALIFPNKLNKIHNILRAVASETFTSVSSPIQFAAVKAYTNDFSDYLNNSRKILNYIGSYVFKELNAIGIECIKPQGGFYMLCDFSKIIKKSNKINNSTTLCKIILQETGFAMLPGKDFGLTDSNFISRIAFVDFNGKKALEYANKNRILSENFLNECCPKIKEGVDKLIGWIKNETNQSLY